MPANGRTGSYSPKKLPLESPGNKPTSLISSSSQTVGQLPWTDCWPANSAIKYLDHPCQCTGLTILAVQLDLGFTKPVTFNSGGKV